MVGLRMRMKDLTLVLTPLAMKVRIWLWILTKRKRTEKESTFNLLGSKKKKAQPKDPQDPGSYMAVDPNDPGSYMGVNPDSDDEDSYMGVDPSNPGGYMAVDPHKKKKNRKGVDVKFAGKKKSKAKPGDEGSYMGVDPNDPNDPGSYMGVNPDSDDEDSYMGVDPSNPGGYMGVDPHKKKKNRSGVDVEFGARKKKGDDGTYFKSQGGDEGSYMGVSPDGYGMEDSYMAMEPDFTIEDDDVDAYLKTQAKAGKKEIGYQGESEDWINEQHSLLEQQPWYKGDIGRGDALKVLANKPRGSFLIRASQSQPGTYACSVMDKKVDHMLLIPSFAGANSDTPGATRYRFGTKTKLLFNTVPKLVAYYIGHELHGTDLKLLGKVKVEDQEGGFNPTFLADLAEETEDSYLAVKPDFVAPKDIDKFVKTAEQAGKKDKKYQGQTKEWLDEQHMMMDQQPWFKGDLGRGAANKALYKKPEGSFVVRPSTSRPGHYACSFVENRKVDHMLVLPSYAGKKNDAPGATRYRFGTKSKEMFNTVPKLIAYYIGHAYANGKKLKGVVKSEDQTGGFSDI